MAPKLSVRKTSIEYSIFWLLDSKANIEYSKRDSSKAIKLGRDSFPFSKVVTLIYNPSLSIGVGSVYCNKFPKEALTIFGRGLLNFGGSFITFIMKLKYFEPH